MASIDVSKTDLFEILKRNHFVMSNDAVLESAQLLEKKLGVSLKHPISEYLSYEIRNKLVSLKNSWQKMKTLNQEQKFQNEISRQTCKFQIRNVDIEQDSLMVKFEACKESKDQLENRVKELANELLALKQQLNQTNTQSIIYMQPQTQMVQASIATNQIIPQINPCIQSQPIIDQSKQTIQRIDLGTKKTIRKILLQNCYDQIDQMEVDTAPTQATVLPITSCRSISTPMQVSTPGVLESFTITPISQSPSPMTTITLDPPQPTLTPRLYRAAPTQSSVSVPISKAPMTVPKLYRAAPVSVTPIPSPAVTSSQTILPKPWTPPEVKLSLTNIDLTKATTEFIIEQKQQIVNMAKQSTETEKRLRQNSAYSKIMKCAKRKNFFTVSNRQQRRLKTQMKESIKESTKFLKNMGLCLSSMEANPIEFDTQDFRLKINPSGPVSDDSFNGPTVNNILYVKDKWSISDRAYNAFRIKCHLNIPTLFHIKKRRIDIDTMFRIKNNEMGVFMSLKEKLKFCLDKFFERKYGPDDVNDPTKFKDNIIHVKLGADGTNIGRNLKLLNFTFTIINEGVKAKQATGNYTIGIFEIENENYAAVQVCFRELIDEMEQLKYMKVGKNNLQLIYYLAADWKMLAHLLGIQSANSRYPCVWCKCNKEDFYKLDKDWSITDSTKGCRTHEEHAAILNHDNKKNIVKYGYDKKPIFKDIIPISRYMIDMLHLFLRISDTLFNLLVKDCTLADNFDMSAISKFDISIYKHMNSLQHFLNEKCNVRFTFLWIAETKKLTWRDLVGPEKIKLLDNFNLAEIIPDHENFKSVEIIWSEFYELITKVKTCQIDAADLKERTSNWLKLFLKVYNKTTVTPYMHAFVQHLHEFVYLYKDINAFNCQGLEKLNDMTTGQYFKGTNKSESALHQILKKRNRIEYLSAFVEAKEDES